MPMPRPLPMPIPRPIPIPPPTPRPRFATAPVGPRALPSVPAPAMNRRQAARVRLRERIEQLLREEGYATTNPGTGTCENVRVRVPGGTFSVAIS